MTNVIVSAAGVQGPRGNSILSGTTAPANSLGFDGDYYINTTNINQIYGPKSGGIWPAPVPFGDSAKANLSATSNPTVSNDSTQGYSPGSVWVNTITEIYYVNTFAGVNGAVWTPVLPVGTTSGTIAAGNDSRITSALQPGTAVGGDLGGMLPNPTVTQTHLSAPLPLLQGGTGSTTQNFVDLTNNQSVGGTKTFTGRVLVPSPSSTNDAVNLGFVQGLSAGLQIKANVAAITAGSPLPANTYNNGASGVGATLTANAAGVLVVDGYTVLLNDRLIVKDEANPVNNGFYTVTTLGTVSVPYVLTRSTDANTPASLAGAGTLAVNGTVNKGSGWVVITATPITIGTSQIVFAQFASPGFVNVGVGLTQVGNTISLVTPVAPSNLPPATSSTYGVIELTGDLGGTATNPQVVSTHLASPLPLAQGGLASGTASGGRSTLGLGTSATANIDVTATDIQPLGTQSAGSTGQVADAGHVHPTTGVVLQTAAASTVVTETAYGQASAVGVDLTYAREDHTHGTPPLTTTAPAVTEGIGQAAAVGTATTPARADHVHPMAAAGTPTNSAVTDIAATGNATTFAASNHTHGREGFGAATSTTTYGLAASNGSAATVSHSDHTHGTPALTTTAPSTTEAIGTAAALGVATTPALADHVHPMAAAGLPTNSAVTDAAATGAATTFAASNHVHGREGFGAVTPNTSFNTSSSNGTATTVSHSDHFHGLPALPVATTGAEGIVQLAGDLGGTAAAPSVLKVNGVSVTGTPAYGQVPTASSSSASAWGILPNILTTGLLTGCVMTQDVSPNAFDLTAGTGIIADYVTTPSAPTVQTVSISSQTVTISGGLTANVVNYWYADSSGVIHGQASPLTSVQKRQNIFIGSTWSATGTGNITFILNNPLIINQPAANINALFEALGGLNLNGNLVSANGANLNINKSAGQIHGASTNYSSGGANNPYLLNTPVETAATFRYVTQNTNSMSATRTTIDVANYDVNGTITALTTNTNAAVHRVYLLPTGVAGNQIIIQYGQQQYTNLTTAVPGYLSENFVVCPDLGTRATLIGYIAVVKNATTLNNTAQATFVPAYKFANA